MKTKKPMAPETTLSRLYALYVRSLRKIRPLAEGVVDYSSLPAIYSYTVDVFQLYTGPGENTYQKGWVTFTVPIQDDVEWGGEFPLTYDGPTEVDALEKALYALKTSLDERVSSATAEVRVATVNLENAQRACATGEQSLAHAREELQGCEGITRDMDEYFARAGS